MGEIYGASIAEIKPAMAPGDLYEKNHNLQPVCPSKITMPPE